MSNAKIAMIKKLIEENGNDILLSEGMEYERTQRQHGSISCFEHSVNVAHISVRLAFLFNRTDIRSLIRGALLHDYFLYDWRSGTRRAHAFLHARIAMENADRDFQLNELEKDIISRHMFPLTPIPPRHAESLIVCIADKLCAGLEYLSFFLPIRIAGKKIRRSV